MFFLNICMNPDILRIIYFGKKILDLLFIIIPIALVLLISIDVFKIVIGANDGKKIKDNQKTIINRIIFAIALFFVPTIVTIVINLLNFSGINSNYKQCITNANLEKINALQEIKDAREEYENDLSIHSQENNNNNNNITSENTYQNLANEMIKIATNEIGTKEGSNNSNKYGQALGINNEPWCAIFVTWVAKNTNSGNINLYKDVITKNNSFSGYASSNDTMVHFYQKNYLQFYYSSYYGGNYTPKKGDYIFFNYNNTNWNKKISSSTKSADHVGIVEKTANGKVYTIEGNTSDTVQRREYDLNKSSILGYGSWYN